MVIYDLKPKPFLPLNPVEIHLVDTELKKRQWFKLVIMLVMTIKVELNRKQVEDYFEINLAFMEQTHSNIVQYIDNNNLLFRKNADSIVISNDTKNVQIATMCRLLWLLIAHRYY